MIVFDRLLLKKMWDYDALITILLLWSVIKTDYCNYMLYIYYKGGGVKYDFFFGFVKEIVDDEV